MGTKLIMKRNGGMCSERQKEDIQVLTSNGLSLSKNEFINHLLPYLSNNFAIITENIIDPDELYWDIGDFGIVDSVLNDKSDYLRICYYDSDYMQGEEPYTQHIDIYFDEAKDFIDIMEYLIEAVDPTFAHSENY